MCLIFAYESESLTGVSVWQWTSPFKWHLPLGNGAIRKWYMLFEQELQKHPEWLQYSNIALSVAQDGLMVQINRTVEGVDVRLLFHLHLRYPSCPPAISVSSTVLSRTQCQDVRQKLLNQAAALPPEPMVHQLVECLQVNELTDGIEHNNIFMPHK